MRRQHFEALTEAFKGQRPGEADGGFRQWCADVDAVAKVYDKLFPRFSRQRFLVACGVPVHHAPGVKGVRTRALKQLIAAQLRIEKQLALLVADVPLNKNGGGSEALKELEMAGGGGEE